MSNVVEMRKITKSFGNNRANNNIDFSCEKGEVVCLLGENGAGKTTVMKILSGQYRPDSGQIFINGREVKFSGSRDAIDMGIQMVHQHFMLVSTISVTDNVMIGKEIKNRGLYDRKKAQLATEELSEKYHLKVSADKLVSELSVGEQQRVEIIKTLYHGAEILILDEPTAVLTPQEVEELFAVIKKLRNAGKTIILITHKLKETMAISDRVYVMRNGEMVGSYRTSDVTIDQLSEMMVGTKILTAKGRHFESTSTVMTMQDVKLVNNEKVSVLKGINLDVRDHEIVGIAGVEGNGQMELVDTLTALNRSWTGNITMLGKGVKGLNTAELLAMGLSAIHADRQKHSIAMNMNVSYNLLMGYQNTDELRKGKFRVAWAKVEKKAEELLEEYDVRPRDCTRTLGEFSGGNQQKFVIAREMMRQPKFLIAAHPTRGVDIMATSFIHKELNRLKDNGAGILLISSDIEELMTLSDRIAVIYDGRIVDCREAEKYTLLELGRLMGGGKVQDEAV